MTKNIHTAILPDGTKATRTSKTRIYSHCVAARRSYEHAMDQAHTLYPYVESNFRFHRAILDGTSKNLAKSAWETEAHYLARLKADIAKSERELAGTTTLEEYQSLTIERSIARVKELKAKGHYDSWWVMGWNGRLDLAQKVLSSQGGRRDIAEAKIVEATVKVKG